MRRSILDAAKQLFVKEGFDNVSMRRIAAAIEYSPAAIYRYFKNKREILSVLREEGFQRFVGEQRQRILDISEPLERLKVGGRGYLQFAINDPDSFHLMFCTDCEEVDLEGQLAESSLASFCLFKQNVSECLDAGHFGNADLETVVFSLWSGLQGLAHLIKTGRVEILGEGIDIDALIDKILAFNLRSNGKKDDSA